jgi:NADP-dependent aldehyde dehydrogenase
MLGGAITRDAGQLCTKPGLIFVPEGEAGAGFGAALRDVVADADTGVMLGERLYAAAKEATDQLERHADVEPLSAAQERPPSAGFALPAALFTTSSAALRADPELADERFGPIALVVSYRDVDDLLATIETIPGQLTATIQATDDDEAIGRALAACLLPRAGRLIYNGVPTGVSVTGAMQHGGPYPATTAPAHTSVGTTAIRRFLRPVVWQSAPDWLLPAPLRDSNPLGIPQVIDD